MTQEEFNEWAEKNYRLLIAASMKFFGNNEHVGEIYERALKSIHAYDPSKGSISGLIYLMGYRCMWDSVKRGRKRVEECRLIDCAAELFEGHQPDLNELLFVDSILDSLKPRQREVAIMAIQGNTCEEIAKRYGHAKQYSHRVLKEVREIAREMTAA